MVKLKELAEYYGQLLVETGDCIEFQGAKNRDGYGTFFDGQRQWQAHRWAWTQAHGEIPEGVVIRHRCDNPACVNVLHLVDGTQADNLKDSRDRGRARLTTSPGRPRALRDKQVKEAKLLHAAGRPVSEIAKRFKCSVPTIYRWLRR